MTDKIHWVSDIYGQISIYTNLDAVMAELSDAIKAEQTGEWRGLYLDIFQRYENSHDIVIRGERRENTAESAARLKATALKKTMDKLEYERLKKIYGE